jgi:hypothetical protein
VLAANPPGTLDSLCRRARLDPARLSRRYAALADSLGRASRPDPARTPRLWRPADGFQRGVCLAHAVSLDHGYLSAECARELVSLQRLGVAWVSLSPFGYLPPGSPEILPSAEGGPEEESDEAVCEAGARARALGMRVWLAPQLWTRGWVGDLRFGPSGWERFFERYREFLIHYALLAEREGFDGLVVGHELAAATAGFPDRWRALIGESRRIYRGTLTYDANWGDEVKTIPFWDALDLIGVSFYEPIAAAPTTDVGKLAAGAGRALANLEAIAKRAHRPVVLLEVGYAANPDAPVHPWQERPGPVDLETQRACYEAVTRALGPADWVAGVFWWKWFSGGAGAAGARATDASYSPRGKPAEQELKRAFAAWRTRGVRVP